MINIKSVVSFHETYIGKAPAISEYKNKKKIMTSQLFLFEKNI